MSLATVEPAGSQNGPDQAREPSEASMLALVLLLVAAQVVAIAVGVFLGWSAAQMDGPDWPAPVAPPPVVVVQA